METVDLVWFVEMYRGLLGLQFGYGEVVRHYGTRVFGVYINFGHFVFGVILVFTIDCLIEFNTLEILMERYFARFVIFIHPIAEAAGRRNHVLVALRRYVHLAGCQLLLAFQSLNK